MPERVGEGSEEQATFRDVFAVAEFRALFGAQLLSVVGDQFARVALAVLVFGRTGSATLTALTYALTFLPDLIAGPLLSGIADRHPRRHVMVVTDVARAGLVAVMAIPGMPFVFLCLLLIGVQLLSAPFNAARAAILPAVLEGDRYVVASAISNIAYQAAVLAGFAGGGTLVAGLGTTRALLIDAATFVASGVLVRVGVRERPLPSRSDEESQPSGWLASVAAGGRLVWGDRGLRALISLACISGFYVTVEGLAVPYADSLGGGAKASGLLLAASPAGAVIGMVVLTRLVAPSTRLRLLGPLAVAACLPLLGSAFRPSLAITLLLWLISGAASSYQLAANAAFVRAVPDASRGQAFGLAVTALRVAQGLGVLVAGAAADAVNPPVAVAGAGAFGVVAAAAAGRAWARANSVPARQQG